MYVYHTRRFFTPIVAITQISSNASLRSATLLFVQLLVHVNILNREWRCSWSGAYYIFIPYLTLDFIELGNNNCKTRRET